MNKESTKKLILDEWLGDDKTPNLVKWGIEMGFEKGVKWNEEQNKNKYSDEDMKLSFDAGLRKAHSSKKHSECWKEWFEQFKKK